MNPRCILLPLGVSILAIFVVACVTLQPSFDARSSPDAAVTLVAEFYDLQADMKSHILEARHIFNAKNELADQVDVLKGHPLFDKLRKKMRGLSAQYVVDPSNSTILANEVVQSMSEDEFKLLEKELELAQQDKVLSDQLAKLNSHTEQLRDRFNRLRHRSVALAGSVIGGGAHVSTATLTGVTVAMQETHSEFERLNMLVRSWNERVQRQMAP